ncbi:Single-stranded dna binding protein [Mycena sanguinolenta]|uniref:Single-stranded dna binding protein n=1 Tax=Mycena sanguinolenta TaxID=230812 RepID=A0A8H6Y7M9_9AGAR|nr:Single-stranded dna binding protein [Mycena sanguinolenta]
MIGSRATWHPRHREPDASLGHYASTQRSCIWRFWENLDAPLAILCSSIILAIFASVSNRQTQHVFVRLIPDALRRLPPPDPSIGLLHSPLSLLELPQLPHPQQLIRQRITVAYPPCRAFRRQFPGHEDGLLRASAEPSKVKRKAPNRDVAPAKKVKLTDVAPAGGGERGNEEIKSIFVVSTTIPIDRNTRQLRGFGHVHFAAAAEAALKMNGTEIDGRAVNVDYGRPEDGSKARENRAMLVGNLSVTVIEDAVRSFFSECGAGVKSAQLPTHRDTGRPKGFGYIQFEDIQGARGANGGGGGRACVGGGGQGETVVDVGRAAEDAGLVIAAGAVEVGDVVETVVDMVDAAHREEELGQAVLDHPLVRKFHRLEPRSLIYPCVMSSWTLVLLTTYPMSIHA